MSVIRYPLSDENKKFYDADAETGEVRCSFCMTQRATAVWRGSVQVYVCKECAQSILPKFMADAVYSEHLSNTVTDHWQSWWRRSESYFWKALTVAMTSTRRRKEAQ